MKELVFQVLKSCFQHPANGYLVMHSTWGIFDIPIAFLDPENVDLPYFWHSGSPHYAFLRWCRPSWKMAPCVNRTHFRRCHHAVSWSHTTMIDFRHADKCWYTAAGTFLFLGGIRCSTTILSVGKYAFMPVRTTLYSCLMAPMCLKWTKIACTMSLNTSLNTSSLTGSRNIMPR